MGAEFYVSPGKQFSGIMAALTWLTRSAVQMRAFAPGQLQEGLAWLAKRGELDGDACLAALAVVANAVGCTELGKGSPKVGDHLRGA